VLALCIIYVRRNLPESPRWQIMHGHQAEAEASIKEIEDHVAATKGELPPVDESKELEIRPATKIGYFALLAQRDDADALLGGCLLLRLGRRERRLPDRERGLPAGGPGEGHRGVLRHRAVLRCLRLGLVPT
jgi:hypothetical protein